MNALARSVLLVLACATMAQAQDAPTPADRAATLAREALQRKSEYQPTLNVPEYDRARVKALADQATQRGAVELERLRAKNGAVAGLPGSENHETGSTPVVSGRVVVALSSSMPEAMLTSYFSQLDRKPESLVVMRGFVGGAHSVRPTGVLMERLRRKSAGEPAGAHFQVETLVDPLFFQQLGIDQVPAVVWLEGVQELAHCDQEDYSKAAVVYGAVSIEAALREARKAGARVPDAVIAKYRGSGWEQKR